MLRDCQSQRLSDLDASKIAFKGALRRLERGGLVQRRETLKRLERGVSGQSGTMC